jgi:hypothetical protein
MRVLVRSSAAAVVVAALVVPVSAQMPEPFAAIPADATALVRFDLLAAEKNPRLAPVLEALKRDDPGFPAKRLFENAAGPVDMSHLATNFPGQIKVVEMGIALTDNLAASDQGYAVFYGPMNPAGIMERFQGAGWTTQQSASGQMVLQNAGQTAFVTMPNEWTMATASSLPMLERMMATSTGGAPSATASASALATFARTASNSFFFAAVQLPDSARAQLAQAVNEPNPMMAMIPGLQQFVAELPKIQTVGAVVQDIEGIKIRLAMTFPDAETTNRATSALNMAWPAAIQMSKMMTAQQDPKAAAQLDKFMAVRFAANGANLTTSIPVSDEELTKLVEGLNQMLPAAGGGGAGFAPGASSAPPRPSDGGIRWSQ